MAADQDLPLFLGLNDKSITHIPKTVEKQRYMTSVAPTQQMDFPIEHDCRHRAPRPAKTCDWRPLVGRSVVDKALGMRASVLFYEATKRINLRAN